MVGGEPREGALDASKRVVGAEVEARLVAVELLARLGGDGPCVSLPGEGRAEARFARAVGGGGVEQVDAEGLGHREEVGDVVVARQLER